jgi:hypothetical protein
MHAAEAFLVSSGFFHGLGIFAGIKRFGGAANGTPRNLFTFVDEDGNAVVVPTITPASMVAVGRSETAAATQTPKRNKAPSENIVNVTLILKLF